MVNSVELISTKEYLTLWTRCRLHRCRYNRVRCLSHVKIVGYNFKVSHSSYVIIHLYIYIYIHTYTRAHTHTHIYIYIYIYI